MENPGKIGHKTHHEDKKKTRYILFTRWQFQRFIIFLRNIMLSDGTDALRT